MMREAARSPEGAGANRLLQLMLATIVLCIASGSHATTFTETFDTQDYAGVLDPAILWDTTAGELTLQPWQLQSAGSLTGMPGSSLDLEIRGDWLFMAASNGGVLVMEIDSPTSPGLHVLWGYGTTHGLDIEGDLAALATTNGLRLLDISDVAFPSLVHSTIGENIGDVEIVSNRVYLSLDDSLRILDISNPASPVRLGSVPLGGGAYRIAVQGKYAYCARGSNLSIVDVSNPTSPAVVATDATNTSFVDVEVAGDQLYASIVDTGVRSYDIADPTNPITLQTFSPGNYIQDLELSGTSLYVAWRGDGIFHLDVHDPADMQFVSSYDTPGNASAIEVVDYFAFVADGTGLQVLQVGGPTVSGVRWYFADGDPQEVAVDGEYAYLAEDSNGLSILSLDAASYGMRLGHLPLLNARDVEADGDYAYVANGSEGFVVVDVSDPTSPFVAYSYPAGIFSTYTDVELDGHIVYTQVDALGSTTVLLWDVSDPALPVPLPGSIVPTLVSGLAVEDGLAAFGTVGAVQLWDVTNPNAPSFISATAVPQLVAGVEIEGDVMYVAEANRFRSYDITNPAAPALLDTASHVGTTRDFSIEGNFAWLATDAHNFLRLDISDPTAIAVGIEWSGAARGIVVRGDEIYMALDNGRLEVWRTMNRRYSQASGTAQSDNVNPLPDPVVGARVTPQHSLHFEFYVSPDGFTVETFPADSAEWLFFATPGPDLRWSTVPLAYQPGFYPVLTELTVDMLYEFGQITSITDTGNDQGKQVRLTWEHSGYDRSGSPVPIVEYAVYRQQQPGLAQTAVSRQADDAVFAPQLAGWDFVTTVPAEAEEYYSVVVPTLADSTEESGIVYSTFMVRARTGTPGVHYDSYADSGYSVDDLAPMIPANAMASYNTGGGNQLSWDPPVDEDFQYFRVYRDIDPDFVPGAGNLAGSTTANAWTDPTYDDGGVFYKISAVDFSGNESDFAAPSGPTVSVDEALPVTLQFHPSAPNPFRSTTSIRFALPADGSAELSIYDVTGRRVRALASGTFEAGNHVIRWNGRDDAGRTLPPGLYLTRLSSRGEVRTGRVVRME